MANAVITADVVAKTATTILENELTMAGMVYRGLEDEFKTVNGYKAGSTVDMRRPADFVVRQGKVAQKQDVSEGKVTLTVDKQRGIDFGFSSAELTLDIEELGERVIKPAMVQLANQVDLDLMALYYGIPNHVTIPSGGINSFADFALALERMSVLAIPIDDMNAILSPSDYWALVGSQAVLTNEAISGSSYRNGDAGKVAGVRVKMSQNAPLHTTGTRTGTDLVDQALVDGTVTWEATKNTNTQVLHMDGFAAATSTVKAGDTFTIADVWDVNPVSKTRLNILKMFTVMADFTASGSEGDLTISPPIILSGAHKTADVDSGTEINDNVVTWQGVASTGYRQNLFFHRNAFALAMVPMVKPPGAIDVGRRTYKGISTRVIPYYDGTNDDSNWRLDILYGTAVIDPRLAVRASLAADI